MCEVPRGGWQVSLDLCPLGRIRQQEQNTRALNRSLGVFRHLASVIHPVAFVPVPQGHGEPRKKHVAKEDVLLPPHESRKTNNH